MSEIVYDGLVIQALGLENESGLSIWAERHRRADDAIPGDVDRREVYGPDPCSRGGESAVAACANCKAETSETTGLDEASSVQRAPQLNARLNRLL